MRKTIIIITGIIIAAVIIAAAGGGIIYWRVKSTNPAPEKLTETAELIPAQGVKLGDKIKAEVRIKCPWHRRPVAAECTPGKGAQLLQTPEISRDKISLGYSVWAITATLKPYRTGSVPEGKIRVEISRANGAGSEQDETFSIPAFKVTPLVLAKNEQKLRIAGAITPQKASETLKNSLIIAAIALGALLLGLLVFRLMRRKKELSAIVTPWGLALLELAELRDGVKSHKIDLGQCFGRLTDIVRGYLEQRFDLHAPRQTTDEFLNDLNRSGRGVPDEHRSFLRDFMTSADLVKFAKLPPDEALLDDAMKQAERLVNETRPQETDKNQQGDVK